jgi:integrase
MLDAVSLSGKMVSQSFIEDTHHMKITLRHAWHDYKVARKLKPKSIQNGFYMLNHCVPEWLDLDMNDITKKMVSDRHLELSITPSLANSVMRQVRTLFNFAIAEYEDKDENPFIRMNPVKKLSAKRAWNKDRVRTRKVPLHKIKDWLNAVLMLSSPTIRDYLIVCLLTGLRKEEAAQLKWENIDFEGNSLHIPNTKNGNPHDLPLSRFLKALLEERHAERVNEYVFPGGRWKASGSMTSPYKAIGLITKATGIKFSPHDLRRTFLLIAEHVGVDEFTRKRLLNHTFQDVTGKHYSTANIEKLREPMELISTCVFQLADLA